MGILLAFLPFFVYFIAERVFGVSIGLVSATAVSAILLVRDAVTPGRTVKVLEIGTLILFGALAAYALHSGVAWTVPAVRLRVDGGLLIVVLISIAIRRPFTLQYAREQIPREFWNSAEFIRTNYVVTAVWAAAFAVMVIADIALLHAPNLPRWVSIAATIGAIYGAFRFTVWYPERLKPN